MDTITIKERCMRCRSMDIEYICQVCQPINSFCSKCDSFVHTLPSKKSHKREILNLNTIGTKQSFHKNDNMTIQDNNNRNNVNPTLGNQNKITTH